MRAIDQRIGDLVADAVAWLDPKPKRCLLTGSTMLSPLVNNLPALLAKVEAAGTEMTDLRSPIGKPAPTEDALRKRLASPSKWQRLCQRPYDLIIIQALTPNPQWQAWSQLLPNLISHGGCVITLSWGPQTLLTHTNAPPGWLDMHDLGDLWLQEGWQDPVMDSHLIQATLNDVKTLETITQALDLPLKQKTVAPLTFELVTGMFWHQPKLKTPRVAWVSAEHIPKRGS